MIELRVGQVMGQNRLFHQKRLLVSTILNAVRLFEEDMPPYLGLDPSWTIPFEQACVVWTAGHIIPRGIINQDMMISLLQQRGDALLAIGREYGKMLDTDPNIPYLAPRFLSLADRRWFSISGLDTHFTLQHGDVTEQMPPTFEGISYDLGQPTLMEWRRIVMENQEHGPLAADEADPSRPGDISDGPVDRRERPARPGVAELGPDDDPDGDAGGVGIPA